MYCKNILSISVILFLTNCTTINLTQNKQKTFAVNSFMNKGFALIYNDDLYKKKTINHKIEDRSLILFQKNLKVNTEVKLTNILNNKSIIAKVGKNSKYPNFYNSVISMRIAEELDLNINEPYIEILEILENSIFVAQKARIYDEEKNVAVKAPVNTISINDLNEVEKKNKKDPTIKFSYNIKIADFYFNDTAIMMLNRIKNESPAKNAKIKKISDKKYRVYLGPFSNINSLQKSFNDISIFQFENIEIIKND